MKLSQWKTAEFLRESNAIENEYSKKAYEDARIAWLYAYKNRKKIFTDEYVLTIHKLLMRRLNKNIAGKYRKCAVWIGGQCKSDYTDLDKRIRHWLKMTFINDYEKNRKKSRYDRDEITKQSHIEFESIHPFADGNGRTGRILYNIHRLNLGLPIHIIHTGEEQQIYYQWFRDSKIIDDIIKFSINKEIEPI